MKLDEYSENPIKGEEPFFIEWYDDGKWSPLFEFGDKERAWGAWILATGDCFNYDTWLRLVDAKGVRRVHRPQP